MKRRRALALGAVVLVAVAVAVAWSLLRPEDEAPEPGAPGEAPAATPEEPGETRRVELFFPGRDGRLHGEERELPRYDEPEAEIAALVEALLAGPLSDDLWPPLPRLMPAAGDGGATAATAGDRQQDGLGDATAAAAPPPPATGVGVGEVYLLDDVAVVDLVAPAGPPAAGARQEEMMLYSLVNSLLLNTSQASRVIVLWNGQQPVTFAGHVDAARPLRPNCDLIAPPRPAGCADGVG
ncbi:MAG: hypothetical protein D6696_07500 [Acidobacteria bacterium]|nr:MAG: hypothetical protein D6696_07500 [Acidobacteriota bacterium]